MKIAYKTFGCKVNQYNTFLLKDNFQHSGFKSTNVYSKADIVLVNACVVTEKAEKECKHFIQSAIRTGKKVIVTGCKPDFISQDIQNDNLQYFTEIEDLYIHLKSLLYPVSKQSFQPILSHISDRSRAIVKIQSGCSQFCSYCIVPFRRGKLYSRSTVELLKEIKELIKTGYQEIVLTGTQIGLYHDENRYSLVDLLKKIDKSFESKLERIRLSSISPTFVNVELIDWMKNSPVACPHLHLSLQSGSNAVLKSMNRPYTREQFMSFCQLCKKEIPDFCVSTDVIVGFPGETEKDFEDTMDLVRTVKFSKVHVFPFSRRPGTKAEQFPNQVPLETIKKRSRQMLELSKSISYTIKQSYIGKEIEVMIEGSNGGFTRNYLKVLLRPRVNLLPGNLVRVVPTQCNDEQLIE